MARQRAHSKSKSDQQGSRTGVKVPSERLNVGEDGFEDPSAFFASAISPASTNSTGKSLSNQTETNEEKLVNTLEPRRKKTIRFSDATDVVGFMQETIDEDRNVDSAFGQTYQEVTRKLGENILKVRGGRYSIDTMDLSTVSTAPPSATRLTKSVSHDDSPQLSLPGKADNDHDLIIETFGQKISSSFESPAAVAISSSDEQISYKSDNKNNSLSDASHNIDIDTDDDFLPPPPPIYDDEGIEEKVAHSVGNQNGEELKSNDSEENDEIDFNIQSNKSDDFDEDEKDGVGFEFADSSVADDKSSVHETVKLSATSFVDSSIPGADVGNASIGEGQADVIDANDETAASSKERSTERITDSEGDESSDGENGEISRKAQTMSSDDLAATKAPTKSEEKSHTKASKIQSRKRKLDSGDASDEDEVTRVTKPRKNHHSNANRYFESKGIPQQRDYTIIPVSDLKVCSSPDSTNQHLRRSKRARIKPLEFWKGEYVEYGPNDFGNEFDGVTNMSVPVCVHKADPTPYKPRNLPKVKGKKTKTKTVLEAAVAPSAVVEVIPFDASIIKRKYNFADGGVAHLWDQVHALSKDTGKVLRVGTSSIYFFLSLLKFMFSPQNPYKQL